MKKKVLIALAATIILSLTVPGQAACDNLIDNGDFEDGITGITTDYAYNDKHDPTPAGWVLEQEYTVWTNPSLVHGAWASYGDRTTGSGNMLIVNGATAADQTIWEQNITVDAGTQYTLTYWLSSSYGTNLANVECSIEGDDSGSTTLGTQAAPGTTGLWIEVSYSWTAGASDTSATITLEDLTLESDGDDFAIDDISLSPPCIEKELTEDGGAVEGEIGIYKSTTTEYTFVITYSGPAAVVIDTVPAEFEVTGVVASDGSASYVLAAKAKGPKAVAKSATIITWNAPAGENSLGVTITTRESSGKGHTKGGKPKVFKPTSCGTLELNDGATAYDPEAYALGEMVKIVGPSNAWTVEAVCGVKPCTPENLVVTGGGASTTLTLTWDLVCDGGYAVVYNIYRDGELYAEGEAGPTYDDTGLDPGTYCYRVEAVYDEGPYEGNESGKSDGDCGTVD